jgi:hypothetical protein
VLFRVARSLKVRTVDAGAPAGETAVIAAGETVRLVPVFATAATAHVFWHDRAYTVEREVFLQNSSPLGPAPD